MAAAFGKVYLYLSGDYDYKTGSERIDACFLDGGFHMDFNIPEDIGGDAANFGRFLVTHLKPRLSSWYKGGEVPAEFYR
ncbi:MAG: hypothetical protein P8Y40_06065, partial [Desulfobacterales bacterium]